MKSSPVLIRHVADLPCAVKESLDFLGYDFSGQRVWVKPNLLGAYRPEDGVTTDPELVRCVVRELRRRNAADVFVFDNPGGPLKTDVVTFVRPTGVVEASEGAFRIPSRPVSLKLQSRFVAEIPVAPFIFDADVIVNLPVFKTHALTVLTGAVKNLFGIIPGGHKSFLHSVTKTVAEFAELLVDIYRAVPVPVLTVVDALRGMDGQNGPSGGRVLSLNRVVAGRDPLAVDAALAVLAGARPEHVPVSKVAIERGIGPSSDDLKLVGDAAPIPGFRLPSLAVAAGVTRLAGSIAYRLLQRRPLLIRRRCIRCQRCAESCPARAITMATLPVVDRQRCIMCFSCVELCPERAMIVPGRLHGLVRSTFGR